MFSLRKPVPAIRTLVGNGTVLQGHLHFSDGVRIDGEVRGDVLASDEGRSVVVVGENAKVVGRVKAAHVIINGEVVGPVVCAELLELQPKARIIGDVRYELLEMHPGATIDGELKPLRAVDRPALKLAASNDA